MADELGVDAVLAIERFLEWEDDQHTAHVLPHLLDAVFFPRPELRADEIDDRDAEAMELAKEAEMEVGEVNEHGHLGRAFANGALELSKFAVDARQVFE